MPYATLAGLVARFGEHMLIDLTDRALPPAGEIDATVVDAALEDTDALIDGHLSMRYALPLATVPRLLGAAAETIAIYKLHAQVVPEKIDKDYRDQLKLLQAIAAGDIRLPGVDGVEPPTSGASGVRTIDRDREMTPETMRGFI